MFNIKKMFKKNKKNSVALPYELVTAIMSLLFTLLVIFILTSNILEIKSLVKEKAPNIDDGTKYLIVSTFINWEFNETERKKYNLDNNIKNIKDLIIYQPKNFEDIFQKKRKEYINKLGLSNEENIILSSYPNKYDYQGYFLSKDCFTNNFAYLFKTFEKGNKLYLLSYNKKCEISVVEDEQSLYY